MTRAQPRSGWCSAGRRQYHTYRTRSLRPGWIPPSATPASVWTKPTSMSGLPRYTSPVDRDSERKWPVQNAPFYRSDRAISGAGSGRTAGSVLGGVRPAVAAWPRAGGPVPPRPDSGARVDHPSARAIRVMNNSNTIRMAIAPTRLGRLSVRLLLPFHNRVIS